MDYAAAVGELQRRGRFRVNLGLERIERLLAELDHPERALRGALVAGTNGKGSVAALVEAALRAEGMRTGTMPSPHLVSYRERIALDGRPLTEARFAAAVERVIPATDRAAARLGDPTEFELLTAAAVAEFARAGVQAAIVEVGMGGRLDATNALDLGVAAVTNVQLDHQRYLGSTLRAIAGEKAAIVKPGNLAVTGASGPGLEVIETRCARLRVPLRRAGRRGEYRATVLHSGWDGIVLDLARPTGELSELRVSLLGGHQAQNAAVAAAVLDALSEGRAARSGLRTTDEALRRGFRDVRWPGRLERVPGGALGIGPVLLDGAHNPAGARVLRVALEELGLRRPAVVFGAIRGKRVTAMLRELARLDATLIFTRVPEATPVAPRALAARWQRLTGRRAEACDELVPALRRAADSAPAGSPIVVCGSLYLVGAARALLVPDEAAA